MTTWNYALSVEIEYQSGGKISTDVRGWGEVHEAYMTSKDGRKSVFKIHSTETAVSVVASAAITFHSLQAEMESAEDKAERERVWKSALGLSEDTGKSMKEFVEKKLKSHLEDQLLALMEVSEEKAEEVADIIMDCLSGFEGTYDVPEDFAYTLVALTQDDLEEIWEDRQYELEEQHRRENFEEGDINLEDFPVFWLLEATIISAIQKS